MRTLRCLLLLLAAAALSTAAGKTWFAYVGTYTGHGSQGIYVFRFDPATGVTVSGPLAAIISWTFVFWIRSPAT